MAKTITINISDVDEKILYNDLMLTVTETKEDGTVTNNEGIKDWHEKASVGKIGNAWKRFQQEWTTKLMNDKTFTDKIPSNKEDFVTLVTSREDYKTRQEKEDA